MTEEEKEKLQSDIRNLRNDLESLQYMFAKKTGSGSADIQGANMQSVNFVSGSSGWLLDKDGNLEANNGNFRGDITGATGTFTGTVTVGSLNIPDLVTADSFHVETDGDTFWGATTLAGSTAKVLKTGAASFSSMTITGGSITGTPIASIPNNSSTDISLLDFTHDIVFSVTDKDTTAWASGTITMSNGRTFSISSGNTGNMSARTYIYLDTAVSSTVLQTTTTVATAMGANKKLIGVAQNGAAEASFQVNQGIGGMKLTTAMTSISNNDWQYSGAWSVTDADTIAWASGTLTTSNGGSYSITGSNTGNMSAKTYVYFDLAVSSTAFQTTTTSATAIGEGKILIAICQNATGEAKFMVVNDNAYNIDAANIVAGSVTATELSTAITYAGTIVVDSAGAIRSGQTAYNTGTGWWIGNDGGTPKFSFGSSAGNRITWDGSSLTIVGITPTTVRTITAVGGTFTVTIASPAVFTCTAHGYVANDTVVFSTTGALPTGLTAGTTYYVISTGLGADTFRVSTSQGGAAVNTSGTQSGVHTVNRHWLKPAGLTFVEVEVVGGGGGGGGADNSTAGGGGGGGGGYSKKRVQAASLGSTETVTVGKGGTGGSNTGGNGTAGGTTSFGSHLQATGGGLGTGDNSGAAVDGGAGGVGSSGDVNLGGSGGTGGIGLTGAGFGGAGGSSFYGGGGGGRIGSNSGVAGSNYGGGGGGGASNSTTGMVGGNGAQGFVIVTEYYN